MINFNLNELTYDNVGQWPTSVKYITTLVLMLFLIGIGFWLLIKPNIEEYDKLVTEQTELKQEFESKQQLAANLLLYKKQIAEMNQRFGTMLLQLPAKNEMANLLEEISKTGIASGLTFELFQPEAEIPHDFYIELPITIVVLGNYHQLAVFISRIMQMSRIVTWHDFEITGLPKDKLKINNTDILQMKISAKIYRYRL